MEAVEFVGAGLRAENGNGAKNGGKADAEVMEVYKSRV